MRKLRIGRGQTALITGASSGIGAALAGCFAQGGFDLVLVARNAPGLRALARRLSSRHRISAHAQPADLSKRGNARKLAAVLAHGGRTIDVLVNNAGVAEHGAFAMMPAHRHQELIDLNVSALTAMLARFLPPMLARGRGRILNVASIAAFQPAPMLATYAATKAYVLSLTESLAEELQGTGVTVTALCPGITATHMLSAVQGASAKLEELPGFLISDVEAVAREGYAACIDGDVIRVPGIVNLATILAARYAPKWLVRRIGGVIGRRSI